MTEAACVLGYADKIIAITDYDRWPEEILDRPRIGGALDPDLERLAVLDPELLVLQGENEQLRRFAEGGGLRIVDVKMDDDVESILQGMLRLDDLLGGPESQRGEKVVGRIRTRLDSMARAREDARPDVLLVLSRTPHVLGGIFSAGRGTFLDELLEVAGARNWAASRGPGYFDVPLDLIAADPPDLVLEFGGSIEGDDAERVRVWSALPGERIEVRGVDFEGLMIPGPRIAESAEALAAAIDTRKAP
jgi:iron complex transport system substrate-binding protein